MPDEPIGITFEDAGNVNQVPVMNSSIGLNVFEVDDPYLMTDGRSLMEPIPVIVVTESPYEGKSGELVPAILVNLGDTPPDENGDLGLNDPAVIAQGITVNNVAFDNGSFTSNSGATRRTYTLSIPPVGSTIQFDVNVSGGNLYFRMGPDKELGPTGIVELYPMMVLGTYHVSITLPEYSGITRFGFLCPSIGTNFVVSNWEVQYP